jgi:integrase
MAAFVLEHDRPVNGRPDDIYMVSILLPYLKERGDKIPSAAQARISARQIRDYFGSTEKISGITSERQRAFIRHQHGTRGHAPATISRTMSVLSAALGLAVKNGELATAPRIIMAKTEIADILAISDESLPARRLTVEELARFVDAIPERSEHLFRYAVLALNTMGRPDAITDLSPGQWEPDIGVVRLNPPGRRQTKKRRPTLPVTDCLAGWLAIWDAQADRYVYTGAAVDQQGRPRGQGPRPIGNLKKSVRAAAVRAGLQGADEWSDAATVTPYTFRRTMARMLRVKAVPAADISAMLGHDMPGSRMTEVYADFDPRELDRPRQAIDQIMGEIESHLRKMGSARTILPPKLPNDYQRGCP